MKKFLLFPFLFTPSLHAAWVSTQAPRVHFNDAGDPEAISMCATDSVYGEVCGTIYQDDQGRNFSVDGAGDLRFKASIRNALKLKLADEKSRVQSFITRKNAEQTRRQQISLPVVPGDL